MPLPRVSAALVAKDAASLSLAVPPLPPRAARVERVADLLVLARHDEDLERKLGLGAQAAGELWEALLEVRGCQAGAGGGGESAAGSDEEARTVLEQFENSSKPPEDGGGGGGSDDGGAAVGCSDSSDDSVEPEPGPPLMLVRQRREFSLPVPCRGSLCPLCPLLPLALSYSSLCKKEQRGTDRTRARETQRRGQREGEKGGSAYAQCVLPDTVVCFKRAPAVGCGLSVAGCRLRAALPRRT